MLLFSFSFILESEIHVDIIGLFIYFWNWCQVRDLALWFPLPSGQAVTPTRRMKAIKHSFPMKLKCYRRHIVNSHIDVGLVLGTCLFHWWCYIFSHTSTHSYTTYRCISHVHIPAHRFIQRYSRWTDCSFTSYKCVSASVVFLIPPLTPRVLKQHLRT